MKLSPRSSSQATGFTLVELLVTMAILSVILTMAFQVTESSRRAVRLSESKSGNDAIAREVFDRINRDVSQMIVRKDARLELNSANGNDTFAFLTQNKGVNGASVGTRNVSLIRYELTGNNLSRSSQGHNVATNTLNLISTVAHPTPTNATETLSSNVLRMEVEYLVETAGVINKTVTVPAPGPKGDLRGLIVTIATADEKALRVINRGSNLATIASRFADAVENTDPQAGWTTAKIQDEWSTADTKNIWSTARNTLAIPGIPTDALKSIRIYQRTFLIP